MQGRICFPKNPWPKGHAIEHAIWSGRLDPNGALIFDFDLRSASYDADDPPRDDDEDDDDDEDEDDEWRSRAVWMNYHRCSLSSTKWGHRGVEVGSPRKPFAWRALNGSRLRVDPAKDTLPADGTAFGIYLLGHDGVAAHAIRFTRTGKTWAIDWKAKIALAYIGRRSLRNTMKLELRGMTFSGFDIPKGMSAKAARALFDAAVVDPAKWTIAKRRFVRAT